MHQSPEINSNKPRFYFKQRIKNIFNRFEDKNANILG